VIKSFHHKGLKRLYQFGDASGVKTAHVNRLRMQLAALDTAYRIEDMDVPGFKLHPLKGKLRNRWSISVSGNWRLTFEFRKGNAYLVNYEDYH
jgi:proteic killer suppression protein